jgi:hypothetical protein
VSLPGAEGRQNLLAQKIQEGFDGQTGVSNDAAERTRSDLLVVGDDDASPWVVAAEDHVAAGLTAKNKACSLQR